MRIPSPAAGKFFMEECIVRRRVNMALKFMTVPALLAVMLRFAGNLGAEGRATLEGRRLTQPVLPH